MSKIGIIENVLMAMQATGKEDSKKSLNEEDPVGIGDQKDFSEFDKYLKSIYGDLKEIISELDSLEPIRNSELSKKLKELQKSLQQYPRLIRSKDYDPQDPKNKITATMNQTLNSLLMNLISLDGALKATAEWASQIVKAFGGESEYNNIMKESFIYRSSLSMLLEIKSPEEYPPGSIAKVLALINLAKTNQESDNPVVKKYNSDKNFKSAIDKLLSSYQKMYDSTSKNAGNYESLQGEINKRFRSFFQSKTLGGQMKELFKAVKGFFTDPIKSRGAGPAKRSERTTIKGKDLLGESLQDADGPLLLLTPAEIINLYETVTNIIDDAKRPLGIFRDQLAFGGADQERIGMMVDAGKNEAMPYLKGKEDLMEPDDVNPLAAAMISSDYFGENLHRNSMYNLLFEDAEEFVSLYNLEDSPFRKRLSKKSQKNIDAIFPKLAGKLIGTSDHDEVVIDPELKEDPEFDIEELEKKVKLDPDGTLAAIAAIHKAKKAKINTDDKDKIVIEPIDKKSKTEESYKISNSNLIYENSLLKVLFSDD